MREDVAVGPPLFVFERVVVTRAGRRILDVDATISDGGVTAVLGPSGAGKSTLLRLCNRLDVPDEGVVRLRGVSLDEVDPLEHRRRVGMVFQRPTPFAGTVRDNLRVARPGCPDDELLGVLDRVGLGDGMLSQQADDLSGGEAQRMCLARTLLTDPEVLLMDEPTSALDPSATRALERLVCHLSRAHGVPVVWVTHDLAQAQRIADECLVLIDGRPAGETDTAAYLASDGDELPGD